MMVLTSLLVAQEGAPETPERSGSRSKPEKIQPYDKVVTKDAKSDPGLFLVHRIKDKILYEIPPKSLDQEFLWVTQIAKTQTGFGYGGTGVGNRVVRWELRGEEVLLRDVKFRIRASAEDSVEHAVAATSLEPIIASLPVKAWGKDKAPVVDVTELFHDDLPEFSAKRRLNASAVDKKRTFVEQIRSFPENIEAKVTLTYKLAGGPSGGSNRPSPRGARRDPSQGAVTVMLHHSMVQLPEVPMTPRVHDDRVGFFSVSFEEYGSGTHEVENIRYITRWRLEKKDPEADVSEPKKPILFYVGRGVPEKWRPWVKKGIEMWQPAFEATGFKNAILAKDAPSAQEDPDWDAEDARYSVIRWLPSTIENAMGPHVNDPRTGEILEADIIMYHNVLKLCRDWYFVQASPSDERAQQLPLPDDLMGNLLAYVVAHEVGHSLGFPHNMKASNAFTVEQLRDPVWTRKWGTEASIMDYGRFNYVAQPGDGAALIPKIGPYDMFAVEWGYKNYKDGNAEKEGLASLTKRQSEDLTLLFGDPNASEDPSQQTEDLGSDPILATELGLKNIQRVMGYLVRACCKPGEDYRLLRNMYDQVVAQRNRELGHVTSLVGGMVRQNLRYGDADRVFHPVDRVRQKEAIAFLNRHGFQTPRELLDPDVIWRLETNGAADRILSGQKSLLRSLVNDRRIKRMVEHEAMEQDRAYPASEMLSDIRSGIWSEFQEVPVQVDLYRRNLQRAHVELLAGELEKADVGSDLPALSRSELTVIDSTLNRSLDGAADDMTRRHIDDLKARVKKALAGKDEKEPAASPVF
jgi:hypothetical protein